MHKIFATKLIHALFRDVRLHSTATLVRVQLHHRPINTIVGHARNQNISLPTMRRAIRKLIECGWAYEVQQEDHRSPLIIPWMPPDVEQICMNELELVRGEVGFNGEWYMKCILDLIVDDHDFRDNARPHWLTLGDGSGRLEIDRWYRAAKVAIEFHGTQHYRYDPKFHTSHEAFLEQQVRDNAKIGLFTRQGIRYVEIAATELSFEHVMNSVRGWLPLRPIPTDSPLVRALRNMCHSYVNSIHRAQRRQSRTRT